MVRGRVGLMRWNIVGFGVRPAAGALVPCAIFCSTRSYLCFASFMHKRGRVHRDPGMGVCLVTRGMHVHRDPGWVCA